MASNRASSRKGTVFRKNLEYLQLIEQNRAPPVKVCRQFIFIVFTLTTLSREDKVERKGLSLLMIHPSHTTLELWNARVNVVRSQIMGRWVMW